MSLFDVPETRTTREDDTAIAKKSKSKSTTTKKRGGGLLDIIEQIRQVVENNLGQYKDESIIINDETVLHNYIDACIDNHYIAIDTETTGLNPLVDIIAGICIYTPNQKTAYIPINHVSYITGEKSKGQLEADIIIKEFNRMFDYKPDIDMFNATFDIRVLRRFGLTRAYCTWDSSIAARILNENEPVNNLKDLHNKYCLDGKGDAFRFDDLFHKVKFTQVPYNVGYLYAAHDPLITYQLCEFQRKHLSLDSEREDIRKMAWVFHNIEMPIVKVVADMEDTGVEFDFKKNEEFKVKYHKLLDDREQDFINAYHNYDAEIMRYKIKNPDVLDEPINIKSVPQLQALLYDVIGLEYIDKKTKKPVRGTDKDILNDLLKQTDNEVVKTIIGYREFATIVSTFIDKLPECVHTDGRIHCKFNQYGADCITGDSLLLTNNGYVAIQDIFNEDDADGQMIDEDMVIVNRDLEFEHSSHKVCYHNTDTIKLTLRGGYSVEGTPNHPIIVSGLNISDIQRNKSNKQLKRLEDTQQFRTLDKVKVGDIVAIPYGYNIFPTEYQKLDLKICKVKTHNSNLYYMPEYCNEEFAELLGMYHADGTFKHYSDSFRFTINNRSDDVKMRVKYLAKKLFGIDVSIYDEGVTFSSLQLVDLEKYLTKGARNKSIPKIIMQSPKSVVCAYIRGLTLDSSFNADSQRLFISCADAVSFNFLQDSLSNMGILTQVRNGIYDSEYDHIGNKVSTMQVRRLGIKGEMYGKFLKEIGVIQSSKALYLSEYKKSQYLTYNNVYYAYVRDIQYSKNDVYDLHIPETHSFIANSMINHNTGRFSSQDPNLQNIPSKNKEIRQMFKATSDDIYISEDNNSFTVSKFDEVKTVNGWVYADSIVVGDVLEIFDDANSSKVSVTDVIINGNDVIYKFE